MLVVDGKAGEPFDSISWPFAMSDDGLVACAARDGDRQFLVVGGRRSRPFRFVAFPVVTPDGRTAACAASDGDGWFAVVNDREGPRYDWVGNLTIDPAGRVAYVAEAGGKSFVVFGARGPDFDRVTRPSIADGRVCYGGRRGGRWFLVRDGRETPVDGEIESVFGDRGYVLAGNSVMGGPAWDWVGWPQFAPDGRVVHLAARGKEKFLVLGELERPLGESVVWDLEVRGSHVEFGMKRDRKLLWIRISFSEVEAWHARR